MCTQLERGEEIEVRFSRRIKQMRKASENRNGFGI